MFVRNLETQIITIMLKPGRKHSGLVLFLPQSNYGIPLMSVTEL